MPMKRPYCIFDLETTGVNKDKDHIIQFAAAKADPETLAVTDTYMTYVRPDGAFEIGLGAYFKHGITPDFLKDKPTFAEVAPKILAFMDGCDIVGYNHKQFDIPMLKIELKRCGMDFDFMRTDVYDVFLEERRRRGATLGDVFRQYYGKDMSEAGYDAHNALSDVCATFDVMKAQMKESPVKAENMYGEDNFITDTEFRGNVLPCFKFGKYRTVPIEYVAAHDQNYLRWCVESSNLMDSTKKYISGFLK